MPRADDVQAPAPFFVSVGLLFVARSSERGQCGYRDWRADLLTKKRFGLKT
jgi:hypothetical protein